MSEPYIPPTELSKRETNDLFRLVEQSAFPAIEFDLTKKQISQSEEVEVPTAPSLLGRQRTKKVTRTHARKVTIICHRPTGSYFAISKQGPNVYTFTQNVSVTYSEEDLVGRLFFREVLTRRRSTELPRWDEICPLFETWLGDIQRYIEFTQEPDLWSELGALMGFLADTDFDNTPFTPAEQAAISSRIKQAKQYTLASGELTSEQLSRIESRLDQAEEASKRIGRKDWLMMFAGSVFSLVMSDTITPQVASHLFTLLVHGLGHLFGYGSPPPQLP